jgi:RHS repeat-associated protein
MLAMVTDGLGVQTAWNYYPLGSSAGRAAGETPLYSVPAGATDRYIDDRHFYFTSSMPVIAEMIQSDGVGNYRSWRFGYSEAMYHARGRGFQGFRSIVEEDEAAGTRTTTTFHQKFPLTSQPEQIVVNSLKRAGTSAPISLQYFTWRCNRGNRNDTTACSPSDGLESVRFPYLDTTETWTYDAAIADNPAAGTPPLLSYKQSVAADDSTCTGSFSSTSGYDAYGNLTASTELVYDSSGSGGYRAFVDVHCTRTRTSYFAPDTGTWWLDQVNYRTITTQAVYDGSNHVLPAGASNPAQSVTTTYTWNPDRTPDTETVQPGVPNQQRVTGYAYPSGGANFGLPSTITVNGSGDPNGARITSTTYSADGYFPHTVTNWLLQTTTTTTRPEDGLPSQVIDVNGLRVTAQYDAFGFATRVQYRGATDSAYVAPDKLMSLSWCTACFAHGRTRVAVVQDGSPTQYKDLDQFGRTVGAAQRLQDGSWSYTASQYDARGHVVAQSHPYRTGDALYWSRFLAYDVLGRLLQKSVPQNNQDGRGDLVTTYAYSGRQTAIKICGSLDADESKCLNLSRTTDSLGRYVETVDAAGNATKFWYDGSGNAIAIRDAKGSVISAGYNAIGQRAWVDDPNQGHWSFTYDALGEVLTQTDAKNIVTSFAYDALGRLKQRSASYDYDGVAGVDAVVDNWTFDPANALGLEGSHERTLNGTRLRRVTMAYDTLSRPVSTSYEQMGSSGVLTQQTSYDTYYGRPKAHDFGNGEALWLQYSAYGDLVRETDATSGTDYRAVIAVDAAGHPTSETYAGGNLTASRTYSALTGQLQSVLYGSMGNANLRRLDYRYDVFGNLARQALNTNQSVEDYAYDALQRLTEASRSGAVSGTVNYSYDAIGNITHKADFSTSADGAYSYTGGSCGGGPNAVKSVELKDGGTRSYCYDANGNMTSDSAGLVLRYDHTQRPLQITRAGVASSFDYDVNGNRFRQTGADTVQYFPALERRGGKDTTYVGSVAIVTTASGTRRVDYQLVDRLGSIDAIADSNGNLIETRGYDAFGKPRTGAWADASKLASTTTTPHGFTGHEHLNQLELIHMNGRVYDYSLGRFTGVDPVIQFPLNSQSLNPYSYILNNPLSGTDPTGYAASCDAGSRRQSCQLQMNQLNAMQAEISSMAGAMGAGANSGGVTARREARHDNGSVTLGPVGAVGRKDQAASASEKGSYANIAVTGSQSGVPILGVGEATISAGYREPVFDGSEESARAMLDFGHAWQGTIDRSGFKTAQEADVWAHNKWFSPSRVAGDEVEWLVTELSAQNFAATFPQSALRQTKNPAITDPKVLLQTWSSQLSSVRIVGHTHPFGELTFSGNDANFLRSISGIRPLAGVPLTLSNSRGEYRSAADWKAGFRNVGTANPSPLDAFDGKLIPGIIIRTGGQTP